MAKCIQNQRASVRQACDITLSAMEISGKHPEHVAGNFWFVFFAYFLSCSALYAVSGNGFISSRWRTVAETRKRGKRHLFVLYLGMSYLAVYVYFQAKSGEYEQVCLALMAFVVTVSHMLRTVLGLWQLHIFKQWVVRSICSMQSLGYPIQLSSAENSKNTVRERYSAAAQEQGRDRAHFDADKIIVNDTIVRDRLSEGDVLCELRFFTPKQKHSMSSAGCLLTRTLLTLFYALESAVCLGGKCWQLLFARSPLYPKPDSTPFLRPLEPEEVWLRWATVLISCAFPNFLTDMRRSRSFKSTSQESEHQVNRDRFAEDVFRSAALHCRRDTTQTAARLLPFHLWRNFPKLSSGLFCKQEFLRHACTAGNGFPFQAPQKHASSTTEEGLIFSYAKYRSILEEARDALPANEEENLKSLGIDELEWLSIFLSIEDWSIGTVEENNDHKNQNSGQPTSSEASAIALKNLCNQLGFGGSPKAFFDRLAVPYLKGKGGEKLWGNRNVLILSAHVDNWLALLAGEQVTSMAQEVPGMEEEFLFRSEESVGVTDGIPEESICPEKQRLMFPLSSADPEHSHFEQSLTFLGCSMENLRSSMANWVESNPEEQSGAWEPPICSSKVSGDAANGRKFVFHASKDFESYLWNVSSVSCWSQRYLQMRLLWELQNNLHSKLPECGLSPNQTEAILLCILSFPAIRVIASEIEQTPKSGVFANGNLNFCCIKIDEKPPTFPIEDCKLTLRASHGPQHVHIEVFFAKQVNETGIFVTAQLCGDDFEEGKHFVWEVWRNAFHGSLQSTHRWQVEHQIVNSSLSGRPCNHRIREGICEIVTINSGIGQKMKVWKGWPTHRETLSKYEMMTDGLILERKKTGVNPANTRTANGKRSTIFERPLAHYVPVSYKEATCQYLTNASLIAYDILRKDACSSEDETGVESAKGLKDSELQVYEILAAGADDDIALGKALNMLISGNPSLGAIERAVDLLEGYFICQSTKAPSVRILESLSRPVQKENWVRKIKRHYEELMLASRFNPVVAISFAIFCSAVPFHRKEVLSEEGIRALTIAIVRTTYSGTILLTFELTKSLEKLMGTANEEQFSLACSMQLNKIEHATEILSRTRNGAVLTTQHLRRAFMPFFGSSENSCKEENISLLPDFKSELEKRKAEAQDRLEKLIIESGTYRVDDYVSSATQLYSQAADNGDLVSAYHLAFLIDNLMPPDTSRANKLYTKAAKLYTRAMNGGIDSALFPLAELYAEGCGVWRNTSYAVELYTRAIEEKGVIMAMYNFGYMLQEGTEGVPVDLPRAFQLFSRAVEEGGDVDAMTRLAYMLQTGPEGVPKDAPYAVRLYERAIKERDDFRAKLFLAHLLQIGADGVPVDLNRAIALYEGAIDEADHTGAMLNLARLHQKGTGVPHDAARATQLFQRVIDKDGNADAMVELADVLIEGAIGVPQDPIRAIELYTRAIEEHGSGDAMYQLASVLEFGKNGVSSDSARAFRLYKRAASEKKHRKAARRLRKVEKHKQVLEQAKHIWSK